MNHKEEVLNLRKIFKDFMVENKDEIIKMLVNDVVEEIKNNKCIRSMIIDEILYHGNETFDNVVKRRFEVIQERMNISEQVKELKKYCVELNEYGGQWNSRLASKVKEAADTIESLSAKLENMERTEEGCGAGWIYCGDGKNLPEEEGFYLVTLIDRITDIDDMRIHKAFFNEKRNGFMDYGTAVIAWRPLPEPYHES